MRKIEIPYKFSLNREFADKFINDGHRTTSKVLPHFLSITFNQGSIDENRIKEINFILDLLYQALIIKNDITKIIIDVDKRKKNYLTLDVG